MINKIKDLYCNFIYGIQSVFEWLPVIWKDRQWDHCFFYEILYHKIILMEECNKDYNPFVSKEKTLKKLKTARLLLKRIVDDDYLENCLRPVDKKFGDIITAFRSNFNNTYSSFWKSDEHNKAWNKASKHSNYLERQDKDMLFELLKKELDGWWI